MKYFIMKQDPRFDDQAKTNDCGGLDPLELIEGKRLAIQDELTIKLSPRVVIAEAI